MRRAALTRGGAAVFCAGAMTGASFAGEPVDIDMVMSIREEGFSRSQVMDTLWHLTDLYGPRLTNSPQMFRAANWARDRLDEMGLENARLDPWGEFGMGWEFTRCVVALEEPTHMPIIGYPRAWTPGTGGAVRGVPVLLDVNSPEDVEEYRGKLAGKIVLQGSLASVDRHWGPMARRHTEETLAGLEMSPEAGGNQPFQNRRIGDFRTRQAVRQAVNQLLREEGVAVILNHDNGSRNNYGVVTLGSGGSRNPEADMALPQVTIATEHFNRIYRLLQRGEEPVVSVDVRASFFDDDLTGYNVIAEIPGTDPELRDEVVMIGAHFDSWHPGTGTTDNGVSSAVMIEAMRILKAIGAEPRRTIRLGLWTGEEQGLLGSRGYVGKNFGDSRTMELQPAHANVSAYFNMDNGGGKYRGVYLQGNMKIKPIFEAWMAPLRDLGVVGTTTMRGTGSTDHVAFDSVGIPGFQFIQDPMDYSSRTHHTNQDLYERAVPDDLMTNAVVSATFAIHAANRDERLPRKALPTRTPSRR